MNAIIRTVLGDIPPDALGRTDMHEHLLQCSPLLRGQELDEVERSLAETVELRDAGIDALVELTPIGIGRDPRGVAEIARRSNVNIVLATGIHREAHYPPEHWLQRADASEFVRWFTQDIRDGCNAADIQTPDAERTNIRAGVIKVGTGYWSISAFEERVLEAAAHAHLETGAPMVCHLEMGTAAWETLELLNRFGVANERILLAHADRNPDAGLHMELAAAGAYLGYDGMARTKYFPDSMLLDCLIQVARSGGAERITLGGDVARRSSFHAYGGMPGMVYLPKRFVPRIRQMGGEDLVETILVKNSARFLSFVPKE